MVSLPYFVSLQFVLPSVPKCPGEVLVAALWWLKELVWVQPLLFSPNPPPQRGGGHLFGLIWWVAILQPDVWIVYSFFFSPPHLGMLNSLQLYLVLPGGQCLEADSRTRPLGPQHAVDPRRVHRDS